MLSNSDELKILFSDIENVIAECKTSKEVRTLHEVFEEEVGIVRAYFSQTIDEIELER